MKTHLLSKTIMISALLLSTTWAQADEPNNVSAVQQDNLQVVVKVGAGQNAMPKEGVTGVDILIYKKGESKAFAHQTKNLANNGQSLEIPFAFRNPYTGLAEQDELLMKVYGTVYNGDIPKLVGLRNQKLDKNAQNVNLTLDLAPVSN